MKLTETGHGYGAIFTSPLKRAVRRFSRMAGAGAPVVWNRTYKPPLYAIKDQGASSSCGGQAGSRLIEILANFHGIKIPEQSAKSVYAPISYAGGGTTVPDLVTQLSQKGSNYESEVTSYENGQPPTEQFISDKSYITPQTLQDALQQANWVRVSVSLDIESIAQAIRDYGAVIFEVQAQDNGTWHNPIPMPPTTVEWAHFICAQEDGYCTIAGAKLIPFYNSWGTSVGQNGIQFLSEQYINSGYVVDAFTFWPDTKAQQITIMSQLLSACQQLLVLLRLKEKSLV